MAEIRWAEDPEEIVKKEVVQKVWGHEEILMNTEVCGKCLVLRVGYECSLHYHMIKDETFYAVDGEFELDIGENPKELKTFIVLPGEAVRVRPGMYHRFRLDSSHVVVHPGRVRIIEISTHHSDDDSYRAKPSRKIQAS